MSTNGKSQNIYLNSELLSQEQRLIDTYCAEKVLAKTKELTALLTAAPASYDVFDIQSLYEDFYNAFGKLTPGAFCPNSIRIKKWLSQKIIRNYRPEGLKFKTQRGENVRSKFEVIIADILYSLGLPYQYELPITIRGQIYYPDFTITDTYSGKFVLIEAFGLMDREEYLKNAVKKIHAYESRGYTLGNTLFLAFDDLDSPFDPVLFRAQMTERFF